MSSVIDISDTYKTTETIYLFRKICKIIYLSCATNFWFEDPNLPSAFLKIYNKISKVIEVIVLLFIALEWGSFFTQHNLTEKQGYDMILFAFSHVIIYVVYASFLNYRDRIKKLVFTLAVTLKEMCNDEAVEKLMIKKTWLYMMALVFICSGNLVSYGIDGCIRALTSNATFTTVIPTWPDVEDRRVISGLARVLWYIIWWIFIVRVISVYVIVLTISISLGHQFTILYQYFIDLNNIFDGEEGQDDKDKRYEDAFKVGIKMHALTLWCVRQAQVVGNVAYSAQIILNISVLVLTMFQMVNVERTLAGVAPIALMAGSVLIATGVFMWSAGDITIEASRLPTALFQSGWHNCRGQSSKRVRKLVTLAITQAQEPVVLKVLGVIELSYQSYVSIVKSSYSLFSVIY